MNDAREVMMRRLSDCEGMIFLRYDASIPKPIAMFGQFLYGNADAGTFTVQVYHDEYELFHFNDFGVTVFSESQAETVDKLLEKLPKKNQTFYIVHRWKDMVEICTCTGYSLPDMCYKDADGVEQKVPITEAGKNFFINKEVACAELMPLE